MIIPSIGVKIPFNKKMHLLNGILAAYEPDNDTVLTDLTGNGHDATIEGASYADGALSTDGIDDDVKFPDWFGLTFTNSFSISMWVKIGESMQFRFSDGCNSGDYYSGFTCYVNNIYFGFEYHDGDGYGTCSEDRRSYRIPHGITSGWAHFVINVGNSAYTIPMAYVNCIFLGEMTYCGGTTSKFGIVESSYPYIGVSFLARNSQTKFWPSTFSQILIHNRHLTRSEAAALFNSGSRLPYSQFTN